MSNSSKSKGNPVARAHLVHNGLVNATTGKPNPDKVAKTYVGVPASSRRGPTASRKGK